MLKKLIYFTAVASVAFFAGIIVGDRLNNESGDSVVPLSITEPETPFYKYSIEDLSSTDLPPASITIEKTIEENDDYTSYLFTMDFNPSLNEATKKDDQIRTTTGQINIPSGEGPFPMVVMYRGYVDPDIYYTGLGTKPAAAVFAENGYITVAADFLGYGNSDENAADIFESRFQTYTTALSVLNAAQDLPQWDKENLFIWGHSNGGHISLAVLEITGADYPTTLWAPVSKPFPYSILFYTDESADKGKFIRQELAQFENLYDVDKFSIDEYFGRIKAPIQLHQGTADDAIPVEWSNDLASTLEKHEVDIAYHVYPGSDHNLRPAWDTVVERDLEFFQKYRDSE